ncbi:aldehyde ferredoxin oxidoreductase family protein [Tepidiforma sp.]|uniref:aldehyde ferredoxin oxidoreductase family protein n=1 Tax=Tepidiforma sp. TaxID=2682230 RepID=UPI002ADD65BF|nr:aldehyde ferredoxin oxidoreductase family protein [Tepidiforma sp.]
MTTATQSSGSVLEKGYNGKMLNVNLTTGEITVEYPDDSLYRQYLGGYGIGARMLWDRVPKGADPLGPENMLGMFAGLLTGTPLFGQRWQVVCKSPLTGGWGDANCGGDFGGVLKLAGWDGIMFFGKAEKPVYLLIDNDKVELRDASDQWGQGAIENEKFLKDRHGKRASVANIGPAGETLSLISGVCNDHGRLAARSGVGAVMGSKNLKAVVALADRKVISQSDVTIKMLRENLDQFVKPLKDFFHNFGTTGITAMSALNGDSPVKNWGGVGVIDFPIAQQIDGGSQINPRMEKSYGCWRCPMACGAESKESTNPKYPYPHHTHRPEYEAMAAFGTMNLVADPDALIYANHLCNEYGFDVISAGGAISMAIECYQNGIITKEDTEGIDLRWGDADAMIAFLKAMGERRGIAAVFADGVKVAAEKIGRGAEKFAMHIGGQELPMHDPKLQPEYYTTYKLDPTPARHTQYEGNKRLGKIPPAPADNKVYTGRGEHHKGASEYMHVVNAGGMCQFVMMAANTANMPSWFNAVTGWDMDLDEMMQIGERIANLRMAYEVREGGNPRKRAVPTRVTGETTEATHAGPLQGIKLDTETLETEFLKACDWDLETCKPSKAKLESLGLADVAAALHN